MKMRTLLITTALACTGFAAFSQANDTASPEAVLYHYGMPLQVAEVVALTEPVTPGCEIVTAHMKYIDTAGRPAEIIYRKLSEICTRLD